MGKEYADDGFQFRRRVYTAKIRAGERFRRVDAAAKLKIPDF
jgi:hypothetical protein